MSGLFSAPSPRPVVLPPLPPPRKPDPEEVEVDEETGNVKTPRRKRVSRAALVRTTPQGVLSPAQTGRRRLSPR